MKKILSILMILVLVGGVAFAQLEPTVSGSATLEWGVDFGEGSQKDYKKGGADNHAVATHGFKNTNSASIKVPLFTTPKSFPVGGSSNKEADVYATVSVGATTLSAGQKAGAITEASLYFYGAYISVLQPSFDASKAVGWNPINSSGADLSGWFTPKFTGYGTTIGYKKADLNDLDVAIKLASNGSWDQYGSDATKPYDGTKGNKRREKDSKYAFGLDFSMEPVKKYLGVSATLNATLGRINDKAPKEGPGDYGYNAGINPKNAGGEKGEDGLINFGLALTSEPIADMKVTLGFDGATGLTYTHEKDGTKATLGWDLGLKVEYKWVEAALYVAGTATEHHGWDYSDDDTSKHKSYGMNMAAHLGFVSDEDMKKGTGFVDNLGLHASLNAYHLLARNNKTDYKDDYLRAAINAFAAGNGLDADGDGTEDITADDLKEAIKKSSQIVSMPIGFNVGVSYKKDITDSMWVKPYAELYGETNHYKQHADTYAEDADKRISKFYLGLAYELGVVFQPMEKVQVSAKWNHGKLNTDTYEGGFKDQYMIDKPINHKNHNGTFVLGLKLMY